MESYDRTLRVSYIAIAVGIASIIASVLYIASRQTLWAALAVTMILAVITLGLGIFLIFDKARALKTKRVREQTPPLKITLEIGGEPITIEAPDTERVEEILKLVQRLHANPPSRETTEKSSA